MHVIIFFKSKAKSAKLDWPMHSLPSDYQTLVLPQGQKTEENVKGFLFCRNEKEIQDFLCQ
jgi:hypothetical protein